MTQDRLVPADDVETVELDGDVLIWDGEMLHLLAGWGAAIWRSIDGRSTGYRRRALSPTAARIWELAAQHDFDEVVTTLRTEFADAPPTVERDVRTLLDQLVAAGLLVPLECPLCGILRCCLWSRGTTCGDATSTWHTSLIAQQLVERITFVEPPSSRRNATSTPESGISALRPRLLLPRRLGGLRITGAWLQRGPLRWQRAVHDVTDDWRATANVDRVRNRLIAAEEWLASRVRNVVCSDELANRWRSRYGVDAVVIPNGVDLDSWRQVDPVRLPGLAPHVGYVGTLHDEGLDIELLVELAAQPAVGTVHLVGPDLRRC